MQPQWSLISLIPTRHWSLVWHCTTCASLCTGCGAVNSCVCSMCDAPDTLAAAPTWAHACQLLLAALQIVIEALDLLLQVLTTGSWPTQTAPKCTLPREVDEACTRFRDFYLSTHSGRKLSWQTNMGNAGRLSQSCFCMSAPMI